ncbi:MAG: hypothetical protein BAJALOKI2v1_240034 [Promethearchaeota archaeon]|nr:MAG: hypothetical protein BAJALOKI2v1_240034 [Candidatus Lokiarchaeota archaeon]
MNDDDIPPPICYICKKDFKEKVDRLYYCICDIAVCNDCINSVKKNDTTWLCPKCNEENNLEESRLIRPE